MPKLSDRAEDILEELWTSLAEGNRESIALAELSTVVNGAESELTGAGLIELKAGKVALTATGQVEAEKSIRRHRLAERLLADILDVGGELMDDAACGFEHVLYEGVEENICTLLGHPRVCPHGKPIPRGRCCKDVALVPKKAIAPVSDLKPGQKGKIAYVQTEEARKLQKLMAMGILPGVKIEVEQRFPSYVIKVGHSQFAVDEEIANAIYVRLGSEG